MEYWEDPARKTNALVCNSCGEEVEGIVFIICLNCEYYKMPGGTEEEQRNCCGLTNKQKNCGSYCDKFSLKEKENKNESS